MPAFAGHTTVREPLGSYGSRCSAADIQQAPMGKESWVGSDDPSKPVPCPRGPRAEPLVLIAAPADQVGVYPPQGLEQCRFVEMAVVVDPTGDVRVEHPRQIIQGLVAPSMGCPPAGPSAGSPSALLDWPRAGTKRRVDYRARPPTSAGTRSRGSQTTGSDSLPSVLHPCSRRALSSANAAPACRPRSGPPKLSALASSALRQWQMRSSAYLSNGMSGNSRTIPMSNT